MARKKITLDAYIGWLMDETVAFRTQWRHSQKSEGRRKWPEKMLPGDWDEQFDAFIQTVRQGDKAYED